MKHITIIVPHGEEQSKHRSMFSGGLRNIYNSNGCRKEISRKELFTIGRSGYNFEYIM
ncbi:MAG: hypothetical protein ACR2KX_01620 [Chitinophagaceae bacterium]